MSRGIDVAPPTFYQWDVIVSFTIKRSSLHPDEGLLRRTRVSSVGRRSPPSDEGLLLRQTKVSSVSRMKVSSVGRRSPPSDEGLLVDPHERARVVGSALVLDAVEAVAPLAVVPLVVVIVLHLPHRLKQPRLGEL